MPGSMFLLNKSFPYQIFILNNCLNTKELLIYFFIKDFINYH